jgi:transcriptional regulator with XRE-family HTH domain
MLLNDDFTREEYVAYERAFTVALGRNIRRARRTAQLSQKRLAQAAGLSTPLIAEIETAARGIGLSALQQVADALGITSTSLLPKP